jgi:hypothetical protein
MTVYSVEKCWQHSQATSFLSESDDVNFPLTVANCTPTSPFESQLNNIWVIQQQNDNSTVHWDVPKVGLQKTALTKHNSY